MVQTLVASVLESLQRGELPASESLAGFGESEPEAAARALQRAASLPELSAVRASWVPALLLSARPGQGAQCLYELARRSRESLGRVLDLAAMPSLVLLLGASEFLARKLIEHPEWARDVEGDPPAPPNGAVPPRNWNAIAENKYRGLLRIAARELLGCPLQESQAELSGLAERCLRASLDCASQEMGVAPPGMLALDELGSRELSVSPDVDLLFLESDSSLEADPDRPKEAGRLVEYLMQQLGTGREGGVLYRVGRGLDSTLKMAAVVPSVSVVLGSLAGSRDPRVRSCLLRARSIGGVEAVGRAFVAAAEPILYSTEAGPPSRNPGRWRLPAEGSRRPAAGSDLKHAPGGIRDLEFIVHSVVLRHGRQKTEVRTGNIVDALLALGRSGVLDEGCARALIDCYGWLRRAEHFLHLGNEESTWEFPRDKQGRYALARCMGYREPDVSRACSRLLHDWQAVRDEVQARRQELLPSD